MLYKKNLFEFDVVTRTSKRLFSNIYRLFSFYEKLQTKINVSNGVYVYACFSKQAMEISLLFTVKVNL